MAMEKWYNNGYGGWHAPPHMITHNQCHLVDGIILLVSSITVYGGTLHSLPHNHFSFWVCEWRSPHFTVSKRLLHSYQKAICLCETVKSKLSIIMKWLSMPSDLRERRCRMNRLTIWEIACQLIRMQTLYHAGTMKPVSQLKGAIRETGENNVCAGRCHSM